MCFGGSYCFAWKVVTSVFKPVYSQVSRDFRRHMPEVTLRVDFPTTVRPTISVYDMFRVPLHVPFIKYVFLDGSNGGSSISAAKGIVLNLK